MLLTIKNLIAESEFEYLKNIENSSLIVNYQIVPQSNSCLIPISLRKRSRNSFLVTSEKLKDKSFSYTKTRRQSLT